MKIITVLSILFLLFACHKDKLKLNNHLNLVGDYEWYHSYSIFTNDSESYQSVSDQHGIRIKENGKLEFYTNGDLVDKGYVYSVMDTTVFVNYQGVKNKFIFSGDGFTLYSYPIEGQINQYKKHD